MHAARFDAIAYNVILVQRFQDQHSRYNLESAALRRAVQFTERVVVNVHVETVPTIRGESGTRQYKFFVSGSARVRVRRKLLHYLRYVIALYGATTKVFSFDLAARFAVDAAESVVGSYPFGRGIVERRSSRILREITWQVRGPTPDGIVNVRLGQTSPDDGRIPLGRPNFSDLR